MSQQFMDEMIRKLENEEIKPEDVMAQCQQYTLQLAHQQAKQFLEQVTEIEIIDSHRMANLMVENQVRTTAQTYHIYRLDTH